MRNPPKPKRIITTRSKTAEEFNGGSFECVSEMDEAFDLQGSREDWTAFVGYLETLAPSQYEAMKYKYRHFPNWIYTEVEGLDF